LSRSPYAVCEGIRRRNGHSIETAARHWAKLYQFALDDLPYLNHALWLKYEDFCADPLQQLERVRSFLELTEPFEPTLAAAPVKAHNLENQPSQILDFNQKSIERLSAIEIDTITQITGPLMERLGYEKIMP
jgi:hypothetical protein